MLHSQDAVRMSGFFNTLTQVEKYILLLFYADELSTEEIGIVLEIPEARVTLMLQRLRAQAMALLQADEPVQDRSADQRLAKSA